VASDALALSTSAWAILTLGLFFNAKPIALVNDICATAGVIEQARAE
jgi:hypothetical protein